MERFVCIHGHFYQPPRENPWLEAVELQESAAPFHDWNDRITAECYAANAASRVLDNEGWIERMVNNYSRISFNFGPTLLSWMEQARPEVYKAILEADRQSQERFSGHGNALAQVYNHMIMPLANTRDQRTQVEWGIRDFQSRFSRNPEGMWLAEAAVNTDTLEQLAAHGIAFTVLAPRQAQQVRKLGSNHWHDVGDGRIDPSMPYLVRLPSGRHINVFFYDGPISQAVAFEHLLNSGESFARRLMDGFSAVRKHPQLVHVATDGESYGHHHMHGDMALAFALQLLDSRQDLRLTNYGEFLARFPPAQEAKIVENSSWSCVHGVERWRADCGCNSGRPNWNQRWRKPLREALDWLRDQLAPRFEEAASSYFKEPWKARNGYIDLILDRSEESRNRFLALYASHELNANEQMQALKLMEMQRHAMLMFTSCGWFFDEISGIETVQVMAYAGRALQLASQLFPGDEPLETEFLQKLELAQSNLPSPRNGRAIYDQYVRPAIITLPNVAAHYAISSLFEEYGEEVRKGAYLLRALDRQQLTAGKLRVATGTVNVTSTITTASARLNYAVLDLGEHNVSVGVRPADDSQGLEAFLGQLRAAMRHGDIPELVRMMDQHFGHNLYSLKVLFRDEQHRIVQRILSAARLEAETAVHQLYNHHAPMLRFVTDLGITPPNSLQAEAQLALNHALREAVHKLDERQAASILDEMKAAGVVVNEPALQQTLHHRRESLDEQWAAHPDDPEAMSDLIRLAELAQQHQWQVDWWRTQNMWSHLHMEAFPGKVLQSRAGHPEAQEPARTWVERFERLGRALHIRFAPADEAVAEPTIEEWAEHSPLIETGAEPVVQAGD